ncbi:unnamed protein product [Effrenium voratum]|nr:unnamed protein product [Effrenium voratum]
MRRACRRLQISWFMAGPALSILTWNTLAPVYFRQAGAVEARQPLLALRRTQRICDAIAELRADLVCLQEHFFEPEHQKLYQHFADAEGYSC